MFQKCVLSVASATILPLTGMVGAAVTPVVAQAAPVGGVSPAVCAAGDNREPGIQGDVSAGLKEYSYNCGVRLVGQLPIGGGVQGVGTCAYVRTRDGLVHVVDTKDPAHPVEVRTVPVLYGSETFRVVVAKDRSIMVSGSSVYDIRDCLNPVLKGEIKWPPLAIGLGKPQGGGGGAGFLPHDLRINHTATKIYASMGLWEVDISNLEDPESWKVTDFRCDVATQIPGPWQELHRGARKAGIDLCKDLGSPTGANWRLAASGNQIAVMWPLLSHGPDVSGDDKYVYVADTAPAMLAKLSDDKTYLHVIDVTQRPVKVVGRTNGPGHGLDWFRVGGRQYVMHSNELGTAGLGSVGAALTRSAPGAPPPITAGAMSGPSDTCAPYPRIDKLGWAFDAVISDVTNPAQPRNLSHARIAINDPENCAARKASGRDPVVGYHLIDDAWNAHFAMINFGTAGLRFFDIRNPAKPVEVAYFNNGVPVHGGIGAYDAQRGLVYASAGGKFLVLEIEPQVKAKLGL
jgi:hypothetical protein